MTPGGSNVDSRGPVFISYRQSDGRPYAIALARMLRAAGVPVWRDNVDLPPGDTNDRLREALQAGLSGAILLVTPQLEFSSVVRDIELPGLLHMDRDPGFSLFVANTIARSSSIDYEAPDRLLRRPLGTISSRDQRPLLDLETAIALVDKVSARRIDSLRPEIENRAIHIDIQTRAQPRASDRTSDVPMRLAPASSGRMPSDEGIRDLVATVGLLPGQVERSGATAIRLTGRAQLSVALAIGCSLPATFLADTSVQATDGLVWNGALVSGSGTDRTLVRIASHTSRITSRTSKAVLVYVDLVPGRSDDAFISFLSSRGEEFEETLQLEHVSRSVIDPNDAVTLTSEIAGEIRAASRRNGNARVHLILYTPFPIAVLLGRLLNTLKLTAYEWNDTGANGEDVAPHYVEVLDLAPTNGRSLATFPTNNPTPPEEMTMPWTY